MSEEGTVEWNTPLEGIVSYILPTDDQAFLLVGSYYDMDHSTVKLWSCKIDDSGVIEWEKSFETDQGDHGIGITAVQNGIEGFTIVGQTNFSSDLPLSEQDQAKLWVINIQANGTINSESFLIAKDLPKYYIDEILIPEDRSGYVIAGDVLSTSEYPILFKMDHMGQVEGKLTILKPVF